MLASGGDTNNLWGQTNPARLINKDRGISRVFKACVLQTFRLLPLLYIHTGRSSVLPLAWLNVYLKDLISEQFGTETRWAEWKLFHFVIRPCGSKGRWGSCFIPGKGRWASTQAGVEWPLAQFPANHVATALVPESETLCLEIWIFRAFSKCLLKLWSTGWVHQ